MPRCGSSRAAARCCCWAPRHHGQGHETAFKQILHEKLGIDPNDVQFIDGDTDRVAFGMGSNGSRSMVAGGTALVLAANKIIEKGKLIAAHLLEVGAGDVTFADGKFSVAGTDRSVTLKQVAVASFLPARLPKRLSPGLIESATYSPEQSTYPNGCHVCEVEVDPETGAVELKSYLVVDDVGTVINPLTLAGQIHGGVAQGVGQILMEQVAYRGRTAGQLLTASFMDYAMPRADTMCNIAIKSNPVPTTTNLLGAKGAGEAGTVGALPAVMIAILNALAPLGVRTLEMPATSDRVWQAIQAAREGLRWEKQCHCLKRPREPAQGRHSTLTGDPATGAACATCSCRTSTRCASRQPRMVGLAFTMRFIPSREDKAGPNAPNRRPDAGAGDGRVSARPRAGHRFARRSARCVGR